MRHLIIKVCATLKVLLCPLNEQQDVGESADCILVTPDHHVCKSDVVASRNMTRWNLRVHRLQCKHILILCNVQCSALITTQISTNMAETLLFIYVTISASSVSLITKCKQDDSQ